jgi:hypothetical protein
MEFDVAVTKLLEKKPNATIHTLERGLWWVTPERPLPQYLIDQNKNDPKKQPIQYWLRPNHSRGVVNTLSVVRSNNAFIETRNSSSETPAPPSLIKTRFSAGSSTTTRVIRFRFDNATGGQK